MVTKVFRYRIWLVLIVGIILTGCTPSIPSNFEGIVADTVCKAPCWQGIVPGETQIEKAIEILNHSEQVDKKSIEVSKAYGFEAMIFWDSIDEYPENFVIVNEKVAVINLRVVSTKLEKVLQTYGDPDRIFIKNFSVTPNREFLGYLIYQKTGTSVEVWIKSAKTCDGCVKILSDSEVTGIIYFEPENVNELVNYLYLQNQPHPKFSLDEVTYPWQGYGEIQLRPDPERYWN